MSLSFYADSLSLGKPFQLRFEDLEPRQLLSVGQSTESDLSFQFVAGGAVEFWDELNRRELLLADGDIAAVGEGSQPQGGGSQPAPLPAIPIDDTIDPFTDCPGLDDGFCLPGDADRDGSVGFLDFLRLSYNFGSHDASWDDGDFDGDGRVTFGDFLILSNSLG